jgi:hypothetical protein
MGLADPGFWGKRTAPWAVWLLLLAGCGPTQRTATWSIYPLPRRVPHDGLAVVSQPDGYGLHIWIETDTRRQGLCQPRWTPDAARLFNGNGSAPFSAGLAPRQEFFDAVARQDVRRALRRLSRRWRVSQPLPRTVAVRPPLPAALIANWPLAVLAATCRKRTRRFWPRRRGFFGDCMPARGF